MPKILLAEGQNVAIYTDDSYCFNANTPRLYLHKDGAWYDEYGHPFDNTKNRLRENVRTEARGMRETALSNLTEIRARYTKLSGGSEQPKQQTEAPKQQSEQQGDGGMSAIMSAVGVAIAEQSKTAIMEDVLPSIIDAVKEKVGLLPKVTKIEYRGKQKEITGIMHETFNDVLTCVVADVNVMLTGPAGSGKNHLCEQVAEALSLDFYAVNAVTDVFTLTGFMNAAGQYVETDFYRAYTNGGLFMFDEIDASSAEALVTFNMALANGSFAFPNGRAKRHEDFRCVAAANTFGTGADLEYVGRTQLDAATLDRFALIHVTYSPAVEEALADGNADLLVFIRGFRAACDASGTRYVVSYRAITRIQRLVGAGMAPERAVQIGLVKSLDVDSLRTIKASADASLSSNKYFRMIAA